MENIVMLIKVVVFFVFLAVSFLFMIFPILLDVDMKKRTGTGVLNRWMTGIELICVVGVITYLSDTSSDGFYEALGCLAFVVIISIVVGKKKAKKLNLDKWRTFMVVLAQVVSPLSILFIVFMLENFIKQQKKRSGKNR